MYSASPLATNQILATVVMLAVPLVPHGQNDESSVEQASLDHIAEARMGLFEARQLAALGGIGEQAVFRAEVRLAAAVENAKKILSSINE